MCLQLYTSCPGFSFIIYGQFTCRKLHFTISGLWGDFQPCEAHDCCDGRNTSTFYAFPNACHNLCVYQSRSVRPLLNTLRPRQNGRHFADDILKCILMSENLWISLKNSLKFIPKVRINSIPALVQIMAWRRSGDKPLSEPMVTSSLTHICVSRPQWVKAIVSCHLSLLSLMVNGCSKGPWNESPTGTFFHDQLNH